MADNNPTLRGRRADGGAAPVPGSGRCVGLVVISVAQLMVALDATIMNIALPSAQRALEVSDADRQWVITAYTLALAGLLLLGGRIADHLGHKRAFLIGLAGFAAGSALGGAAVDPSWRSPAGARRGGTRRRRSHPMSRLPPSQDPRLPARPHGDHRVQRSETRTRCVPTTPTQASSGFELAPGWLPGRWSQ